MGIRVNEETYVINMYTPQNDDQKHTYNSVHFHIFFPFLVDITYWIGVSYPTVCILCHLTYYNPPNYDIPQTQP